MAPDMPIIPFASRDTWEAWLTGHHEDSNGLWLKISNAMVPDDLRRALDENDRAREFFDTLDSVNRYAILYRIQDARKPETRAKRIEKYVAMFARHEKIYT